MQILNETLSVPSNIHESAIQVYDLLSARLPLDESYFDKDKSEYRITIQHTFKISDITFNEISYVIHTIITNQVKPEEGGILVRLATSSDSMLDKLRIKNINTDTIELFIDIAINPNIDKKIIFNTILFEKETMIKSIAHELKHAYDNQKQKYGSVSQMSNYVTYTNPPNLLPVRNFYLYLYYVHDVESLVRPTEVYSKMRLNDVSKSEFINFLKGNDTYQMLNNILSWNLEDFKKELKEHIPEITEIFQQINNNYQNGTDDEKVNEMLNVIYHTLTHSRVESFKKYITTSPSESFFGFSDEKLSAYNTFVKRVNKYKDNPIEFYKQEEKNLHTIASRILRKIGKLYALAKDSMT